MSSGKKICETLKAIRCEVARANDIHYEPAECHHQGNCKGTCPKCEQEVRYIEQQLQLRSRLGKAVRVAGVAMGLTLSTLPAEVMAQTQHPVDSTVIKRGMTLEKVSLLKEGEQGVVIKGQVIDEDGEGIIGASVFREGTKLGVATNIDGMFWVEAPVGCELRISYVGYKTATYTIPTEPQDTIVKLVMDEEVMGEVVIIR